MNFLPTKHTKKHEMNATGHSLSVISCEFVRFVGKLTSFFAAR